MLTIAVVFDNIISKIDEKSVEVCREQNKSNYGRVFGYPQAVA